MIACQAFRCGLKIRFNYKCGTYIFNHLGKCSANQEFRFMHSENPSTLLVYEGPLKKRIFGTKILSLTSSLMGASLLPMVLGDLNSYSPALAAGFGLFSSVFLSTPLLLHYVTRRYVLSLRYDPSTRHFHATTYNLIGIETTRTFTANDVTVPDIPGMLCSFHAKGERLFVDAEMVKEPEAYSHMMGYDKPLDLHPKKDTES